MVNICNMKETKMEGRKGGSETKDEREARKKRKESSAYVIHFKLGFLKFETLKVSEETYFLQV